MRYVLIQIVLLLLIGAAPWAEPFLLKHPPFLPLLLNIGEFLLFVGLFLMTIAMITLGSNLTPSPKPKEDSTLVTKGVYKYARHPIYTGLMISCFGFSLASSSFLALIFLIILGSLLNKKVLFEETLLTEKFGSAYTEYKNNVRRFF